MSLLLAIDPGLANVGLAVIDPAQPSGFELVQLYYFGTQRSDRKIRWRNSDDQARRCAELARFYRQVIQSHGATRILAELPIGGAPNSAAATDLARAATVLISVAECFDCATEWYSPQEVKKAAAGRPGATKEQVMSAVGALYPSLAEQFPALGRREHVADAIGVWLAGRFGALARL